MSFAAPTWWPQETVACFDDLASYRLVGASACAERISAALISLSHRVQENERDLVVELAQAGRVFCALKPDTALYVNVVELVAQANQHDRAADVVERAVSLSQYRRQAQRQLVEHATSELAETGLLLVHDYSSTVLRILAELGTRRPRRVIVTAGEPLGQGEKVAHLVGSFGHQVIYTPDMSVSRVIKGADAFITGVESFYADGSLANTVGTLMLGLLCREHGIPMIAPTECLKYDRLRHSADADALTARLLNPWFEDGGSQICDWQIEDHVLDAVPSSLVSSYVTETGKSSPGDVGATALAVWAGVAGGQCGR